MLIFGIESVTVSWHSSRLNETSNAPSIVAPLESAGVLSPIDQILGCFLALPMPVIEATPKVIDLSSAPLSLSFGGPRPIGCPTASSTFSASRAPELSQAALRVQFRRLRIQTRLFRVKRASAHSRSSAPDLRPRLSRGAAPEVGQLAVRVLLPRPPSRPRTGTRSVQDSQISAIVGRCRS